MSSTTILLLQVILGIVTFSVVSLLPTEYYYIVPTDSSIWCNRTSTNSCLTLQQFALESALKDYRHKNITLEFATGNHLLRGGIRIYYADTVILISESYSKNAPIVTCKQVSCFLLVNITTLHVQNLTFFECSSETQSGGAIYIVNTSTVSIIQCKFANNVVTRPGGAIQILVASNVHILQSQFTNNSAICHPSLIVSFLGNSICSLSCNGSSGGLSIAGVAIIVIEQSTFNHNSAYCYGGALSVHNSKMKIINSFAVSNSLLVDIPGRGGAVYASKSDLVVVNTHFSQNRAFFGGCISAETSIITVSNCTFMNNIASSVGGAAHIQNAHAFFISSFFLYNSANSEGGAVQVWVKELSKFSFTFLNNFFASNVVNSQSGLGAAITIRLKEHPMCILPSCSLNFSPKNDTRSVAYFSNCTFFKHFSTVVEVSRGILIVTQSVFKENIGSLGGALLSTSNILYLSDCFFNTNSASLGGAVYTSSGFFESNKNVYLNHDSIISGGALYAINTTLIVTNDMYYWNSASENGAAIFAIKSQAYISGCNFSYNRATDYVGGVVYVSEGTFSSINSIYKSNYARHTGGALFSINSVVDISQATFINNTADFGEGAAIFHSGNEIHLCSTLFEENNALERNSKYVIQLANTQGVIDGIAFSNNTGSLSLFYSSLNLTGVVNLRNNTSITGGALTLIQSTVFFLRFSEVTILGNNARFGGGIFLSETNLRINTSLFNVSENIASTSGGGIFGYQSQINVFAHYNRSVQIMANRASEEGGAISAVSTSLKLFYGHLQMSNNRASKGGALFLSEGSKVYVQKARPEKFENTIKLIFYRNSATLGGAIYVSDISNAGILCKQSPTTYIRSLSSEECFIQTLRLYYTDEFPVESFNYINVFFHLNNGTISGNDIFGGLLDRCRINAFSEILRNFFTFDISGVDYIKAIARFDIGVNYNVLKNPYDPVRLARNITRQNLRGLVSSAAVQLCFCIDTTHYNCSYQHSMIFIRRGERFSVRAVTVDQVKNTKKSTVFARVISVGTQLGVDQSRQPVNEQCTVLSYNVYSTLTTASLELYPSGPCKNVGISRKVLNFTFLPCDCPNGLQKAPIDNECKCECDTLIESYIRNCELDRQNTVITITRQQRDIWIQYVIDNSSNITGFLYTQCPGDYCISQPVNISLSLPWNVDEQCALNRSGILCGKCKQGLSLVFGSSSCAQCSNTSLVVLLVFAVAGLALVLFILVLNMTVATGTLHGLVLYANIVTANRSTFLPTETILRFFVSWLSLDLGIETCFYDGMDSYAKVLLQLVFPLYIILLSALIIVLSEYWGRFAGLIGRKNPVATLCTLIFLSYSKLLKAIISMLQFTSLKYPDGSVVIVWWYDPNINYFQGNHIPRFLFGTVIIILGTVYTVMLFFGQWFRKYSEKKFMRWAKNSKYNSFLDAYHAPFKTKHRYWIGLLLLTRIIHHLLSALLADSTHLIIVTGLVIGLLTLKLVVNKVYRSWFLDTLESSYLVNLLCFAAGTYYVRDTGGNQTIVSNLSVFIAFFTFVGILAYHVHAHCLMRLKMCSRVYSAFKNIRSILKQKINACRNVSESNHSSDFPLQACPQNPSTTTASHIRQLREPALDLLSPLLSEAEKKIKPTPLVSTIQPVTSTIVDISELDDSV